MIDRPRHFRAEARRLLNGDRHDEDDDNLVAPATPSARRP
jgi:hypothetical protein